MIWYNILLILVHAQYSSSIGSNPSVKGSSSVTTEVSQTPTDAKEFRRNPSEVTMILSKLPFLGVTIIRPRFIFITSNRCLLCNDQSLNRRCEWRELKKSAHLRSVWILQYSSKSSLFGLNNILPDVALKTRVLFSPLSLNRLKTSVLALHHVAEEPVTART